MNPYDSLPKRKRRVSLWWLLIIAGIAAVRLLALARDGQESEDDGLSWWVFLLIVLVVLAVLLGAIFGGLALGARSRRRKLEKAAPGAAVFLSGRGPELYERLGALGFAGVRLPERTGVTVDQWGVSLWGGSVAKGPLVTLKREFLAGVVPTMGETGNGIRTFTGPALGVIARLGAPQPGHPPIELLVPIPIYSARGYGFARTSLAWEVLQSAGRFLPIRQHSPAVAQS